MYISTPHPEERRDVTQASDFVGTVLRGRSVAEEPKKISTYGGLSLGVLGYSNNNAAIVFGALVWWVICQTIAHLRLSIGDD